MKIKSDFIRRNLSALTMLTIYVITVMIHLFADSFILGNQIDLILTMLPFILLGCILDYILRKNQTVDNGIKILTQLMPAAIFAMQLISTFLEILGKDPIVLFDYLFWLLVALPFFIGSYRMDTHRQKLLYSMIGAGAVATVYLFLTTQTDELNEGSGAVIFFLTYFLSLYAASGINKLHFFGTVLGFLNAAGLLILRYNPLNKATSMYGWDYDISGSFEIMLLVTLIVSILLSFLEALLGSRAQANHA